MRLRLLGSTVRSLIDSRAAAAAAVAGASSLITVSVDLHQKVGKQNQGWKIIGSENLVFYVFQKPLKTSKVQI